MAAAPLKVLELRKRLLLERISLQRGEMAAHLRGVRRGVSWVSLGVGALGAIRGAAGALAVAKLVAPGGQRKLLPMLLAGATAAWGLGKAAAGMVRRRWLARRGVLDVASVK
ncbi:MAG TPA: hypothetical protein PLU30_10140 [Verrucomicrobiae bacterium]|nr:hypothetical protein [Verrucomicrobiae bacterium]